MKYRSSKNISIFLYVSEDVKLNKFWEVYRKLRQMVDPGVGLNDRVYERP